MPDGACEVENSLPAKATKRIHITGNAGVGKSTLARELARALMLPFSSLDSVVWKPGWGQVEPEERRRREYELTIPERWIIEGVSPIVREAADTLIFLDYPRTTSFIRCIRRNWRYLFKSRPELPENCPEILIIPTLIKIIWLFPKKTRGNILRDFGAFKGNKQLFHIRNDRELSVLMDQLCACTVTNTADVLPMS